MLRALLRGTHCYSYTRITTAKWKRFTDLFNLLCIERQSSICRFDAEDHPMAFYARKGYNNYNAHLSKDIST